MPRQKFAWAALPDEQLLGLRLKDLKVAIDGTWLEDCLGSLHEELEERGIRVFSHSRVSSYDGDVVQLADGRQIPGKTLLWTAGTMPHPLISTLPCGKERGRVKVTTELAVPDWPGVWALGDCALVFSMATQTCHGLTDRERRYRIKEGSQS